MPSRRPLRIETERLVLRRPRARDARRIFARYSSDGEVTRFLGWPRHRSVAETRAFAMKALERRMKVIGLLAAA